MNRKFNVYGIGNAIVDLQLKIEESDLEDLGLRKSTMELVDEVRQQEILDQFSNLPVFMSSGGSVANSMIAMAQLKGHAAFGCRVGDDKWGKFYRDEMQEIGVKLSGQVTPGRRTGSSVILITPDADRTMNTHLGISAEFSSEDIEEEYISQSEWLYIEGYLFATDLGRKAVDLALVFAKKHNVKIAVAFSDVFIVEECKQALTMTIQNADLIFANVNEARSFTGIEEESEVFSALSGKCLNVVMTLRERGAMVLFEGNKACVDGFRVDAVDETGAGDMFAGAFLYGVTHGLSCEDSTRLACFLASRVVSQLGPRLKNNPLEYQELEGLIRL